MEEVQRAVTGVRNALAAELLPAIQPIVVALTEWIAANREWLRTKIHDAVQGLIAIFKELRQIVPRASIGRPLAAACAISAAPSYGSST